MNEKKIHKDFLNEPPPISIPSPDEAWENMQRRLDEGEKEKPVIAWWVYPATIILLLIITVFWIWSTGVTNKNTTSENIITNHDGANKAGANKDKVYKETVRSAQTEQAESNASAANRQARIASKGRMQNGGENKKAKASVSQRQRERPTKPSATKTKAIQQTRPASNSLEYSKNDSVSKSNTDLSKIAANSVDKTGTGNDKKEVVQDAIQSIEEDTASDKMIEAGFEWSAQIPMNGTTGYFAGPAGSSQPYRSLFPGFWICFQAERSTFTLQVNPFTTAVLSNKPYSVKNTISGSNAIVESRTLHKIFGTTAGFSYDYNIKQRWWLGANLQGNFWRSGAGTVKGEKSSSSNGTTSVIYQNNYSLNDSAWADFTKFQAGIGIQLFYKLSKWQAGIRFDYNLVPLIDKEGQKNTTTALIFIRRQLYSNRKKN